MISIAVMYDETHRPDTTGAHCLRALRRITRNQSRIRVSHVRPLQHSDISSFDVVFLIDDGLKWEIPEISGRAVTWAIDTHISPQRAKDLVAAADLAFAAQRDGALTLSSKLAREVHWLPLACDPMHHGRRNVPQLYDLAFVGNVQIGNRPEFFNALASTFPASFFGNADYKDLGRIYSSARIAINKSVGNDLNMRVFEALCSGAPLLTNDLDDNGLTELFDPEKHFVTFSGDARDASERAVDLLSDADRRRRIGAAGQRVAIAEHTYDHRMRQVLRMLGLSETASVHGASQGGGYFSHRREDVLELVPVTAKSVLDVGCGCGETGAAIRERQNAVVHGVELSPLAARVAASALDHVTCQSIEEYLETPIDQRFDCIVCADVLEHLTAPLQVLRSLSGRLSDEGTVVISLPNVRHHSVLQSLFAGNFTYEDAGLLDDTHLRFFTRSEAEKLLFRAGFSITRHVPVHTSDIEHQPRNNAVAALEVGARVELKGADVKDLYVYQHLFSASLGKGRPFGLTSIVIVVHDQIHYTRHCLQSIRRRTCVPYELIVVDNGSKDATSAVLQDCEDVVYIRNDENLGFPRAANQGIEQARGSQVLLLNNDTVVTTGWLTELLDVLYSSPEIGAVGPVSNNVSGLQQIDVSYKRLEELDGFAWRRREGAGDTLETERLVGFCLLVSRDAITRIGLLDEQFGIGNFEDDDYCVRLNQAGYKCMVAPRSFVHHFGGVTFKATAVNYGELIHENRRLFDAKHSASQCPGLGCVIAVRNASPASLWRTLCSFAWQSKAPDDMVLADFGSDDDYRHEYAKICEEFGWRFVEFGATTTWHPARAYNFAISQLAPQVSVVFKCDADILLSKDVLDVAAMSGNNDYCVFPCIELFEGLALPQTLSSELVTKLADWNGPAKVVDGVAAFPREWFIEVGGYDEEYNGWGFEDSDLRYRAERSIGVNCSEHALILHQWHRQRSPIDDRNLRRFKESKQRFTLKRNIRSVTNEDASNLPPYIVSLPPEESHTRRPRSETIGGDGCMQVVSDLPKLSAIMIVRDNADTIAACLDSLLPWFDEIVVVDTGSTDRTPQICSEYKVRHFRWEWQDSFAAARNVSLNQALGEWVCWIDSDDTLPSECGQKLRELAYSPHRAAVMGYVMQVHCPGETPSEVTIVDHVKLLRNTPEIKFEFRIHEQVIGSIRSMGGEVEWTDIFVVHSGSDRSRSARRRKAARDLRLLNMELRDRPNHPFVLFNLGMTYSDLKDFEKAVHYLRQSISNSEPGESQAPKAFSLLIDAYCNTNQMELAVETCNQALRMFPDEKEISFRAGGLYHTLGRLDESLQHYQDTLTEQNTRTFSSRDGGITSFKACHNLAILLEDLGREDEAVQEWRKLTKLHRHYLPGWWGLLTLLQEREDWDEIIQLSSPAESIPPVVALVAHSKVLAREEKLEDATAALEEALRSDNQDSFIREQLARLAFARGFMDTALPHLESLRVQRPNDPALLFNLGRAYLATGRREDARAALESSLLRRPEHLETKSLLKKLSET